MATIICCLCSQVWIGVVKFFFVPQTTVGCSVRYSRFVILTVFSLYSPGGIAEPRGVAVAKSKYDRNKQVKFVILAPERLLLASRKRAENTEDRISRRDAFHLSWQRGSVIVLIPAPFKCPPAGILIVNAERNTTLPSSQLFKHLHHNHRPSHFSSMWHWNRSLTLKWRAGGRRVGWWNRFAFSFTRQGSFYESVHRRKRL